MIVNYIKLIGSVFMGWSLGSNHSANVFGAAVASKAIRYKNAILLCALFVIIGAFIGGASGIKTLSSIITQNLDTALITTVAAATTVLIMTILKIPVSTSQAMVCAIIGIGLSSSQPINLSVLPKILIVWVGTPTGAILVACILYPVLKFLLDSLKLDIFKRDFIIKIGLIIVSCYAAYALGANNVANVIGVYANVGILTITQATLVGGISIAIGVLTYGKKIMMTVGGELVKMDTFSALIAVLAHAIVLDVYSRIGVPASSSEAIIGAVIGVGLLKGLQTINVKKMTHIGLGWLATPLISCGFAFVFYKIYILIINIIH